MYITPFGNPLDTIQHMAFELTARTCRGSHSLWKRFRALGFVPAFVLGVLACAPTANAGADQTVAEGATVTLDGSGSSDSANRALTYAWSQTSGVEVELSSTGVVRPSFLAPTQLAANATLTFSLTVTASGTNSQPDTVAITVSTGSTAPTVGGVGFFGNPYRGDTCGVGERISIAVSFDNPVSVTGMPQVALTIGTRRRYATFYYAPADGRHTYFRYWGQPGDVDMDGGVIGVNALTLNGGSIVAAADGTTNAVLTHDAVAADATSKVDGGRRWIGSRSSPPQLPSKSTRWTPRSA